ncbi:nucleoside phosphatase family-domain-containing protein [Cladochytrium replicatum]|nr:nucleoside phosphatase family-domain-containing protein [Cladochytrium replicatum]
MDPHRRHSAIHIDQQHHHFTVASTDIQRKKDDDYETKAHTGTFAWIMGLTRKPWLFVLSIVATGSLLFYLNSSATGTTESGFTAEASRLLHPSRWGSTEFAKKPLDGDGSSLANCPTTHGSKLHREFALIIDAGSTGSRIHVYRFLSCVLPAGSNADAPPPTLEDEVFVQTTPGLSSFRDDPQAAARSLDKLLIVALENVPIEEQRNTLVTVKATAGLRLLGKEKSDEILSEVEHRLRSVYPFRVVDKDGVVVMDGKDEGVFAWITVNYLLGNLGKSEGHPTAAVMDLGGASTQIVFEPAVDGGEYIMVEGDHKYELTYGGRKHVLFQHSYLRYGLMESRKRIKSAVASPASSSLDSLSSCHEPTFSEVVKLPTEAQSSPTTLKGKGADFRHCKSLISGHLFDKSPASCDRKPCSFDGVYQPRLVETFGSDRDLYAFSYFFDRTHPLGIIHPAKPGSKDEEGISKMTVGTLREVGSRMCASTHPAEESASMNHLTPEKIEEYLAENPDWCLDLAYMYSLLADGYELPDDRVLKLAQKIRGVETGWALGAAMHLMDEMRSTKLA